MEPLSEPSTNSDQLASANTAHMFPQSPSSQESGFFHHFWAWLETSIKMVRLRGQLALIEAKQAGSHYGLIVGFFAAAFLMALLGYLFLIITAVFAISLLIEDKHGWLMAMGGAALLHILAAIGLILLAKSRAKIELFEKTKEEFKKDHAAHDYTIN